MATGASENLRRVWASAPDGVRELVTIELSHPAWPVPYFLTSDPSPFTAKLEDGSERTFNPLPFTLTPPKNDGQGLQSIQLVMANVDREMSEALELASTNPKARIRMVYRVFTSDDLSAPAIAPLELHIDNAELTVNALSATPSRADLLNRRFPGEVYRITNFPGLNR